ncbi:hypothetical protein [Psychrobacter glacincola]|uniref:hypothetical protein n=1 Tax=Psychrobacter glacincola TaxID=56810 RepID=UPI0039B11A90
MPIYLILRRYWLPLLLLLIVVVSLITIKWYGANQYSKGVSSAKSTMQIKLDELNIKQAQKMAQASANYQIEKTKRENEQGVKYVEVEKIVDRVIYRNVCLDDDGLSAINSAAGHK